MIKSRKNWIKVCDCWTQGLNWTRRYFIVVCFVFCCFFLLQCQNSINTLYSFHWHAILLNIFPCPRQLHTPLLNVPFKNPFKSKWRRGVPSNLFRSKLIFPRFALKLYRVCLSLDVTRGVRSEGWNETRPPLGPRMGPPGSIEWKVSPPVISYLREFFNRSTLATRTCKSNRSANIFIDIHW